MELIKNPCLWLSLFLLGCGSGNSISLVGVTDIHSTAIAFTEEGDLLDFYHVTPGSGLQMVTFLAPENGTTLQVVVVGPSVLQAELLDVTITSNRSPGFMGAVEVEVQQDQIVGVSGNGFRTGSPLTLDHLREVKVELDTGKLTRGIITEVVKMDPYLSELVFDADGNEVPKNLSPSHQEFILKFREAMKTGDREFLSGAVHKDHEDRSRLNTTLDFLMQFSGREIQRFRFMRFNPEHPDNEFHLRGARHSLPVEWILSMEFVPMEGNMFTHIDILLGSVDDRLFVPTKYAK